MTVCVIGLGYIGLPTAVFIASRGQRVIGVDTNPTVVNKVNKGEAPFYEVAFDSALRTVTDQGLLTAQVATPKANTYIIAVPTPLGPNHQVDNTFIQSAAEQVAPLLEGGELVILESTSPPGTTRWLADFVIALRPDLSTHANGPNAVHFAHAPERVLPGRIMVEMAENSRVVGGLTPQAGARAREIYASFSEGDIHVTDAKTAEMVKLAENTFRDVNIAYANELSIICEKLGIDVWELISLANEHPRVNILQPGPGVGGHCIAVDPWFIVASSGDDAELIRTARQVNDNKPKHVVAATLEALNGQADASLLILGMTFKPDVEDMRMSPALTIIEDISSLRPDLRIYIAEPFATSLPSQLIDRENLALIDIAKFSERVDLLLILVDHSVFDSGTIERLKPRKIIDTRGLLTKLAQKGVPPMAHVQSTLPPN